MPTALTRLRSRRTKRSCMSGRAAATTPRSLPIWPDRAERSTPSRSTPTWRPAPRANRPMPVGASASALRHCGRSAEGGRNLCKRRGDAAELDVARRPAAGRPVVVPLQPGGGFGGMLLTRRPHRDGTTWPARFVCRAAFIDCEGPHDEATSRRLAAAFARGGEWQTVQSLHLDDEPDETCWCEGNDWWLSTRTPEQI